MRTPTLLTCLQLTDSAFPSGLYALSQTMEGFAQEGLLARDPAGGVDGLLDWLGDLLLHGVAPSDGAAVALAHRAASEGNLTRLLAIDERLFAGKLAHESRDASVRTGRQVLDLASELAREAGWTVGVLDAWGQAVAERRTPGCQAVVTGCVFAAAGVGETDAVTSDLFALASSVAGAALRLRLTDHRGAQRLLTRAAPLVERAVGIAQSTPLEELGATTPMADWAGARHERAEARLFMS